MQFFSCKERPIYKKLSLFIFIILYFSLSSANFDSARNEQLEQRLHKIYVDNYSKPVLDSDWFKFVEAIEQQVYTVRPGDTLWSISKVYFGDGFYWSKLWSVNQTITNPHLIHVGDNIYFKAGNFNTAPNVRVEKGEQQELENVLADDTGTLEITSPLIKSAPISPIFKEYVYEDVKRPDEDKEGVVIIEDRPKLNIDSRFTLKEEILSRGPEIRGKVVSVGKNREISPTHDRIFIDSFGSGVSTGDVVSILRYPVDYISGGFRVRVVGLARVESLVQGRVYKARLIEQFGEIPLGSQISSYQPPTADLRFGNEVSNVQAEFLETDERSFFGEGDIVFLKSKGGSFTPGEVLRVHNSYDPNYDSFYLSGLVKVLSSSDSYATGVILHSQTELNEDSRTGL